MTSPGLDLVGDLVGRWSSRGATLSPDAARMAYVSDRRGTPEIWVTGLDRPDEARVLTVSSDPVISVHWSPDGEWLAAAVATDGGVRTQVWVLRPDGSDAHRVAGGPDRPAVLGPWARTGHELIVGLPPVGPDDVSACDLIDAATGERTPFARGGLVDVVDITPDRRFSLLRDGRRGAHFCIVLDHERDEHHQTLPYPGTGSTESGVLRPSPDGLIAYLVTDAGLSRAALVAVTLDRHGRRRDVGMLADRDDGELEHIDADDAGQCVLLVWNVGGRSVLELFDPATRMRTEVDGLPGAVITDCVLARDGHCAIVGVDGPTTPPRLWCLDLATTTWRPVSPDPELISTGRAAVGRTRRLVEPTWLGFLAHDGLPLSGWLYRPSSAEGPGPIMISLHGGPESQERPEFSAQHQALVAAGVPVFAPNVRGSAGFGRAFAHADDRYGRYDAIEDVRSAAEHLIAIGVAEPGRIAVGGRSYGGYLTLAALARFPDLFTAGVDVCGMSDLLSFFRDTEPWIAAAAASKYGDPEHDQALLRDVSPLRRADLITAPLLVAHGENDTNVPIGEARQIVAALESRGRTVRYLELAGEGHEYRRRDSRRLLLETMLEFLTEHLT